MDLSLNLMVRHTLIYGFCRSTARNNIHRSRSMSKMAPYLHSAATGCQDKHFNHQPRNLKMKNLKIVSTLIAALMLTMVVGCASTTTHESTGQYVDDTVITTTVKAAILNEPSLKVSEINVETFKGVVQLSGFVGSVDNIATATKVARGVNGVKSVKNDMRMK
jgi:hypothetical protein